MRGISPIVAVVLLIAVSIIAATALYFWTAGIATKQPTPNTPVSITAVPLGSGKILIANLGSAPINGSALLSTSGIISCPDIPAGEQALCNVTNLGTAGDVVIYGSSVGSVIVQGNTINATAGQGGGGPGGGCTVTENPETTCNDGLDNDCDGDVDLDDSTCVPLGPGGGSPTWGSEVHVTNDVRGQFVSTCGIAVTPNGVVHIAWTSDENGLDNDVYYANSSSGWQKMLIYSSVANDQDACLTVDAAGVVHMVWHGGAPNDEIWYGRSDNGFTPVLVSTGNPARGDQYPSIALGPGGVVHVAWMCTAANWYPHVCYANSSNGWAQVVVTNQALDEHQVAPRMDVDSNGVVHIAWTKANDNLYYANSSSGWALTPIDTSGGQQNYAFVDADSNNVVHIAWGDQSPGYWRLAYANSSTGFAKTYIHDVPGTHQQSPSMRVASDGSIHAAWRGYDSSWNVYYGRSTDGWSQTKVNVVDNEEWEPALAIKDNVVHIAWASNGDGDFDVYYRNVTFA